MSLAGSSPTAEKALGRVTTRSTKAVVVWLLLSAGMVFAMAVIGAITRLTESGLSIMEWAPLSGTLPPMSSAEWERLFELYKTIPQYQLLNQGMTLEEFQTIFWWEWVHRLWGRLIGVVFLVPFLWFWLRGQLPAWFKPHGFALLALGMLQGIMGWYMVASGFADRTEVSQYRLVMHLSLAVGIYAYMLWLIFRFLWPRPDASPPATAPLRHGLVALLVLLCVTMVSGGFVAGLRAGFTYNTYPFMDGQLVPQGYSLLQPWIANLFENHAAVQFNHRLLTLVTAAAAVLLWLWSRCHALPRPAAAAMTALAAMTLLQFALGVAALLLVVPVWLGALHQAGALLLLSLVLAALYLLRPHPGAAADHSAA